MSHYKRKRPKTQPRHCQMCKPDKSGWTPLKDRLPPSDRRRLLEAGEL